MPNAKAKSIGQCPADSGWWRKGRRLECPEGHGLTLYLRPLEAVCTVHGKELKVVGGAR